jgi:DNA-binding transcriptional ArsR family regulator
MRTEYGTVAAYEPGSLPATMGLKPRIRTPRDQRYVRANLEWVQRAAQLPGMSLAVGLALWFKVGVSRNETVLLTSAFLHEFGVTPSAKSRALKCLEQAGLIKVDRRPRKNPLVTLIGFPPQVASTTIELAEEELSENNAEIIPALASSDNSSRITEQLLDSAIVHRIES